MSPASPKSQENRKLAAVMFTDIVGYSRMMNQDEAGTLEFLKVHNAILDEQVKAHKGRVIKTIGDSYMVDFTSVVDAVQCAVAIQIRLHKRNIPLKAALRRHIRIGIHLGDVVVNGNDIFGEGVNIAARLEPLSPYGGICVSREIVAQAKGLKHVKVIPRGAQSLKNISHPVDVFQLWTEGMDPTAAKRYHGIKKRLQKWKVAGIVAAVAALIALVNLPLLTQRKEAKPWERWLVEEFDDWGEFADRWEAYDVRFRGGHADLDGGWMVLQKPVPVRPFRMEVTYRALENKPGLITLAALGPGEGGEDFRPGMFSHLRYDPAICWVEENLGHGLGDGADQAVFDRKDCLDDGLHRRVLTYAGGELRVQSDEDSWWRRLRPNSNPHRNWIRDAPAKGFFRFAVRAQGLHVETVKIYFKRDDAHQDVETRAQDQALDGRPAQAEDAFQDLFNLSKDAEEQSRFLYHRALAARAAGRFRDAFNYYQRILTNFPENTYSADSRLNLGLMETEMALRSKSDSARAKHLKNAQGYYAGLIKRQDDHAQAKRAEYLNLEIQARHLGGGEEALKKAMEILEDAGPYSTKTFSLLLKILEDGYDPTKAGDILEGLIEEGDLEGGLAERVLAEAAAFHRRAGRVNWLAQRVFEACDNKKQSLAARRAVVRQWILAEETKGFGAEHQAILNKWFEEEERAKLAFDRAYLLEGGKARAAAARKNLDSRIEVVKSAAGDNDPKRRKYLDWTHSAVKARRHGGPRPRPRDQGGWEIDWKVQPPQDFAVAMRPGERPYSVANDQGRAVDVSIYKTMTFKVRASKGVRYAIHLAEWGAGPAERGYTDGPEGSDGEQYRYQYKSFKGSGRWTRHNITLDKASVDLSWGNQLGDSRLALGALAEVVISLEKAPDKGYLEFKDVYFER